MFIRKTFKTIAGKTLKPLIRIYLSKNRNYNYRGIQITVLKGIFHPGLFFSTKILIDYLKLYDVTNKIFLELGAGSGLISIYAAKRNAHVFASDISELSVKNVKQNAADNNVSIRVIHSNLFEKMPSMKFDFIVINPPFYKRKPKADWEFAWYCGEHSEYFTGLFSGLLTFMHYDSKVIMVLSEDCDIEEIKSLAQKNNFQMTLKKKYFRFWETDYIYELGKA